MIVDKSYEIDSCDDVELELKRESKLEFRLCFDDEREIEALFFIINGCGGDADTNYREHLATFTAENFNVAVVSVDYHCIGNRVNLGGKYYFDELSQLIIKETFRVFGFDCNLPNELMGAGEMGAEFKLLDEALEAQKRQGRIGTNYILDFPITIIPTKNEYQNFGIMQAQDLINALLHIKANPPFRCGGGGTKSYYARKLSRGLPSSFSCEDCPLSS